MDPIFIGDNTLKKSTDNLDNDPQKPHFSPLNKSSSKVKGFALVFFDYLKASVPLWSWKNNFDKNRKLLNVATDFEMKKRELILLESDLVKQNILEEESKQSVAILKDEKKSLREKFSVYVYKQSLIDYTLTTLPPVSWIANYMKNKYIEELEAKTFKVEEALEHLKDVTLPIP